MMVKLLAALAAYLGLAAGAVGADLRSVVVEDGTGARTVLAELVGGPTILHFWATWCGPCREELPELESFARGIDAERLVLVSVDTVDFEVVAGFLDELKVGLASYRQVEGNVGSAFAILGYPSTVVVDGGGEVLFRRQGAIAWEDEGEAGEVMAFVEGEP